MFPRLCSLWKLLGHLGVLLKIYLSCHDIKWIVCASHPLLDEPGIGCFLWWYFYPIFAVIVFFRYYRSGVMWEFERRGQWRFNLRILMFYSSILPHTSKHKDSESIWQGYLLTETQDGVWVSTIRPNWLWWLFHCFFVVHPHSVSLTPSEWRFERPMTTGTRTHIPSDRETLSMMVGVFLLKSRPFVFRSWYDHP